MFGLCVKATFFPETPELQVAEWIEANLMLGASKIIIYILYVSELMMKILKDYERKGKVRHGIRWHYFWFLKEFWKPYRQNFVWWLVSARKLERQFFL